MKRSLPTVSVILYKSKTLANGEHPIMLRLCYNGQRKYKSFGLSCSEKMWNEKKEEVRSTHPYAMSMNTLIRAEVDKANKKIMELERDKADYSVTTLVKDLSKSAPTTTSLFDMFEERISYFKSTHSHNTATGYRTLLNTIKRYTEDTDYELFEVDTEWIRSFEVYLRDNYKDTSIKKFFDCFKAVMNRAVELGYIKASPFDDYRLIRPLDTKTPKRALSVDEMMTLMRYYMKTYGFGNKPKPNLEKTKVRYWNAKFRRRAHTKLTPIDAEQLSLALFICSYMFQGLALVDLANLKWGDIRDIEVLDKEKYARDSGEFGIDYANEHKEVKDYYEINVARSKTNKPVRILVEEMTLLPFLLPFTEAIKNVPDDEVDDMYVFPIYSEQDDTPEKRFGRMTYANYLVNVNLKSIAERLGMKPLTFYSARHTYASALYHANVPMGLIAQNMGRNPADIETYLKDFDRDSVIDANQHLYITSTDAYKEAREERRKKTREERAAAWAEWEAERKERLAEYLDKIVTESEEEGEGVTD
ncbi:MAG: site-specific integrase [Rikenellaceae bacterium]|nr:site-specific integrase [Rikenellaceae bacterium]